MAILLAVLHFVNICAAATVAGGQLCVLLVIVPTKRAFSNRTSVEVHNAMLGHQIDYYMKPAGIVAGLAAIAIVALDFNHLPVASIAFIVVELIGVAGVVVTSRYHNVRTNRMMATWSLDAI